MTAEEVLNEWLLQTDQTNLKEGHYFVIEQSMKEYARLKCEELLKIVAEKAKASIEYTYSGNVGEYRDEWAIVNKDSILDAVDLNEFIK